MILTNTKQTCWVPNNTGDIEIRHRLHFQRGGGGGELHDIDPRSLDPGKISLNPGKIANSSPAIPTCMARRPPGQ